MVYAYLAPTPSAERSAVRWVIVSNDASCTLVEGILSGFAWRVPSFIIALGELTTKLVIKCTPSSSKPYVDFSAVDFSFGALLLW